MGLDFTPLYTLVRVLEGLFNTCLIIRIRKVLLMGINKRVLLHLTGMTTPVLRSLP